MNNASINSRCAQAPYLPAQVPPPPHPFRPGWGDMGKSAIDLFTNTVTILNLLDLRSIMWCLGGTCSVFMHTFQAKRELHCIFLRKKAIIITSKHGTTILFSHCNLFVGKLKEKLERKARVVTSEYIGSLSCPLGIIIQCGRFISKKVY